jgi:DNA-binding transcriptional MerR regulator
VTYSIGEAEELTGIKSHILRYWEEVIPGFAPRKDLGGRRIYSERDIDLILRLKYLINERKFTIEGARDEILRETADYDSKADSLDAIRQIRAELSALYMTVRKYRTKQ